MSETTKRLGLSSPEDVNAHIDALVASLGLLFDMTQPPLIAIAAAVAAHCHYVPELSDMLRRMLSGESVTSVYESVSVSYEGAIPAPGAEC